MYDYPIAINISLVMDEITENYKNPVEEPLNKVTNFRILIQIISAKL